jgi:DNA-binding LacI/PurR family transcriptional regulator
MPNLKYLEFLEQMSAIVDRLGPGSRLPPIRTLMSELGASQATIERCLDELQRQGRIRRERGRGVFAMGIERRSNLIGIYTDGERSPYPNGLFLDGVRAAAQQAGFHVADFGPNGVFESQQVLLSTMCRMGFDGIIAALSTAGSLRIEEDRELLSFISQISVPIVTTRPLAAVFADSVTPDYYPAFHALGCHLRERSRQPVLFLGHDGLPSLARMYGLQDGLGPDCDFRFEIVPGAHGHGAFLRAAELKAQGWNGSLVVGVPPAEPGLVTVFNDGPWSADSPSQLAVTLEVGQQLPDDVHAHVVYRPSRQLGEIAAGMLLDRIHGRTGPRRHQVVPHQLVLR